MCRYLLTFACTAFALNVFSQSNPELIQFGETIYTALAENDEAGFVAAYPTFEESMAFFKNTGKEVTEEKAQEVVAELSEKGHSNFKELLGQVKKEGVGWSDLKLLEVTHDPVRDDTEHVDVYLALDFNGDTLTLRIIDVVRMADKLWKMTDVAKVEMGDDKERAVEMIEQSLASIQAYKPSEVSDEVFEEVAFIPPDGQVDEELFKTFFTTPLERLKVGFIPSDTVVEGEEIGLYELQFKMDYRDFPGWQSANPVLAVAAVHDKKGSELLIKKSQLRKYKEMGLVREPSNNPNLPKLEQSVWLNRALEPGEEVAILGQEIWKYGQAYTAISFTKKDVGQTKTYQDATITLRSLDKNIATFEITNQGVADKLKIIFANEDGQQMQSYSTLTMTKPVYDELVANDYKLSKEHVDRLAESYKEDQQVPNVNLFKVSGNIDRIVFYKAIEEAEKLIPFRMIFSND